MLNQVQNLLSIYKESTWIVAVSTGVDSMVLLDLLKNINQKLVVVHFNHQKRTESDDEAKFLKTYTESINVPLEYIKLSFGDGNFHDQAHELRNYYLKQIAYKYHTTYIITAHHQNDLAESVLMKLSRGSNLYGYAGLSYVTEKEGFTYLKPLLSFPKSALYLYAKTNHIPFFEDASNQEDIYTRNRFRHKIVPELISENPHFLDKVSDYSNQLYEAFHFIRNYAKKYVEAQKNQIELTSFFKEDPFIQKEILAYLLEMHDIEFNHIKLEKLIEFVKTSGPNQYFQLSETYILQRKYQKVSIEKTIKKVIYKQKLMLDAFNVLPNMGFVTFLNDPINKSNYVIKLCYNDFALPLWARSRTPGDLLEFNYGRKKLKDFYIDKKIPMKERDRDIVITDNNNRILAILGRYYNTSNDLSSTINLCYKKGN